MKSALFADASLQRHYDEFGFAVFRAFDDDLVQDLRECYRGVVLEGA